VVEVEGFNAKVALVITRSVGTMACAYLFGLIALISLPDAIKAGRPAIISWIAQTFLQLVLGQSSWSASRCSPPPATRAPRRSSPTLRRSLTALTSTPRAASKTSWTPSTRSASRQAPRNPAPRSSANRTDHDLERSLPGHRDAERPGSEWSPRGLAKCGPTAGQTRGSSQTAASRLANSVDLW
jgi:hypothetical protein